jgi:hypothetical protein
MNESSGSVSPHKLGGPEGLLAHYTTASAAFEHILPSGRLRLSPYRLMRDPVESKHILPSIAVRGTGEEADRAVDEVYGLLRAARDRMRLVSFTLDAEVGGRFPGFDACWSRPRMWEQYSDDHRGACLLFNRPALDRAIGEEWPSERIYSGDVGYTREGIASVGRTFIDDRMFDEKERAQGVADYIAAHRDAYFFRKSDDFASEYEYRVVRADVSDEYAFINYGDALVGVVLGLHFPDWQVPGAVKECSDIGVKLGRMFWVNGRPIVRRVWSPDDGASDPPSVGH